MTEEPRAKKDGLDFERTISSGMLGWHKTDAQMRAGLIPPGQDPAKTGQALRNGYQDYVQMQQAQKGGGQQQQPQGGAPAAPGQPVAPGGVSGQPFGNLDKEAQGAFADTWKRANAVGDADGMFAVKTAMYATDRLRGGHALSPHEWWDYIEAEKALKKYHPGIQVHDPDKVGARPRPAPPAPEPFNPRREHMMTEAGPPV